ncbi:hypothetical protein [Barrientosiimonas endolithica]|uniref:DUF4355 domain-containing protein n=1 Tax=Barrientosiimonas endolithica TaxID=1535208 RepID=A0ABN6YKK3_9MICO|nr:hypothetical protein [Barrientosiimonas endolithica]BDZ57868.1 hypothetical protein GCM10025872_15250 [Barrientosiimonas endolithica]
MEDNSSITTETTSTEVEVVQTPHTPAATEDLNRRTSVEQPETEPAAAATTDTPVLDDPGTADETTGEEAPTDSRLAKVRQEAKGLRERLRASESEADTLREQVAAMRRAEAARAATEAGMADGNDLFRADGDPLDLDDLFGEDGTLDTERLTETVAAALEEHPHWRRQQAMPGRKQPLANLRPGATPTDIGWGPRSMTWQDALHGRGR